VAVLKLTSITETPPLGWRAGLPVLRGRTVTLRELRRADARALHAAFHTPAVARFMWPPPPSVEAFERFIEWTWSERAAGRYIAFAVIPRGRLDLVGLFELRQLQPGFFRGELGFAMVPSAWGTGVFPEAAALLLDFAFRVVHVHRVEARAAVSNRRGNAALRKLGAQREGVLHSAFICDGELVDQNLWAIVDECRGGDSSWRLHHVHS